MSLTTEIHTSPFGLYNFTLYNFTLYNFTLHNFTLYNFTLYNFTLYNFTILLTNWIHHPTTKYCYVFFKSNVQFEHWPPYLSLMLNYMKFLWLSKIMNIFQINLNSCSWSWWLYKLIKYIVFYITCTKQTPYYNTVCIIKSCKVKQIQ